MTSLRGADRFPAVMPGAPARVQLSRRKGFRLQQHAPGAIVVRRPTRWGNPFIVRECMEDEPGMTVLEARERCTWLYDLWLEGDLELTDQRRIEQRAWILEHLHELRGRPLACSCPLPEPGEPDWCHVAVLIRRAATLRTRVADVATLLDRWIDFQGCVDDAAPLPRPRETVVPSGQWAEAL